jgi:hypothetical protein
MTSKTIAEIRSGIRSLAAQPEKPAPLCTASTTGCAAASTAVQIASTLVDHTREDLTESTRNWDAILGGDDGDQTGGFFSQILRAPCCRSSPARASARSSSRRSPRTYGRSLSCSSAGRWPRSSIGRSRSRRHPTRSATSRRDTPAGKVDVTV